MAKKRSSPVVAVTFERAARLYRLLVLLGAGPQTREQLARRLALGIRGFYRDLDALRKAGIQVDLDKGRYVLQTTAEAASTRLPFPDPSLTLGEAQQLAHGRTLAHRKLGEQIAAIKASPRPHNKANSKKH